MSRHVFMLSVQAMARTRRATSLNRFWHASRPPEYPHPGQDFIVTT
jgi:hypothetical protein